ncbi:hypothetical protein [Micromonospora sp. DT229]|uniref:hypothetical protein n=1 Tax=Micromonospora sp. DT229 TaxID=3393430 RepID=UPI003CF161A1
MTSATAPTAGTGQRRGPQPPAPGPRTPGPWVVAATVTLLLLIMAPRYGYHRDELYFLLAGRHLDWGYVDQGPLVPALARLADTIAPGSLVALRTPSAVLAGAAVLMVAAIARQFGAGRGGQTLAALLGGTSGITLASGHCAGTCVGPGPTSGPPRYVTAGDRGVDETPWPVVGSG